MVGTDRPDRSASCRWSIPSSARAARICAALIMAALPDDSEVSQTLFIT
jgi:hypothetical protein